MFNALEKKQISKFGDRLDREITISLIESEHPNYRAFKDFCSNLNQLVPGVIVAKESESPKPSPQILIGNGLRYQTVPIGHELAPFLEALLAFGSDPADFFEASRPHLSKAALPATLTLFIAPLCKFCPAVVRQLIPLPMVDKKIQLIIIDGTLFPEINEKYNIQAVPTLILDENFRWTGAVPLEEIVDTINTRDPASLGAASLENIIKEGQATHLATMMLDSQKIFPSFIDLLIHDKWPVRLGAMVVMEEIVDQNPNLASGVTDVLWNRFHQLSNQIQGDILYLLGEIGDRRAVLWLKEVLAGEYNEEVIEAAKEALDKFS